MGQIKGTQRFAEVFVRRGIGFALLAAALAAVLAAPAAARAQESAWGGIDEAQVRLVSGVTATGGGDSVPLGLEFKLAYDWKVYWRSPGDAGFPPRLDWSGSENFQSAEIGWPAPERFSVLGFETVGYHDEVVLPMTAALKEPGAPARFALSVDYLACAEICVPVTAKLSLALPGGPAAPSAFAARIEDYRDRIPDDGTRHGLAIEGAAARDAATGTRLEVTARAAQGFSNPDLFVEGPERIYFGVPKVSLREDGRQAVLSLPVSAVGGGEPRIVGDNVTLTLVDGAQAMETRAQITSGPPLAPREGLPETTPAAFALILGLAFLGGLILNLMPCVLPVLSLKLLSVVKAGRETRRARIGFLASSAGIIVCFIGLAAAAVAFKAAGYAVGWGVQFQQPVFLISMALIVTLFACNLWGLFEIRLPGWLADTAVGATESRIAGNFMTGVFATILATPCSAPFLGTAVGFALARGAGEIFAVFIALGFGLAAPYLAVAAAPDLARFLPHPGHWMVTLKKILAVALGATALWLLSVLAAQTSLEAAVVEGLILVTLATALVAAAKLPLLRGMDILIAIGLAALAFLAPPLMPREEAPRAAAAGYWQAFDAARIPSLVTTGKVVLVDVTADWCITCKVNEALVLDTREVASLMQSGKVVAMRADWTRRDDAIGDYLMTFGRYGIPFNAVYGPGAPTGIALPELLTRDALMNAIERARESPAAAAE